MPANPKKTKNPSLRLQDPYLEREKLKYSNPLPSREHVLTILAQQGVPMAQDDLAQVLSISSEEIGFFTRRLSAMEREGQIIINRAGAVCVAKKLDLIKCRVSGHRDGFGFAIPEDGEGNDIFLSEREMHKVMHGDRVMVRATGTDRRGRIEGRIAEVLEHAVTQLVGRIRLEHGVWMVTAEDQRISHEILIESGGENGATQGQVVMVQIVMQPDAYRQPIGRVLEVLGNYADPGMEIEIALRKHALPHQFSLAAEDEAHATPKKVRKLDSKGRVDLRDLPLVTIDGETARDFDDAVFAEPQGKGFRLVVAIADVSFYVQPGSALDTDAIDRGTSVYFPRRVIPMLPEALSNGICSLNPEVDRLCMVCDMRIGAKGKVKDYSFYPAVMRSKARLTYNQVWDWLQKDEGDKALMPHLRTLYELFKVLLSARGKRGAIDFDTVETQMLFNDQGKIDTIVPVTRNDAHRIIEECMLAANVCSANFILKNKHKCLFRVHEGPTPERLENLHNFLKLSGLTLGGGDKPTTKDYAALAEQISSRPDASVLQTVLLRSMQQAVYTPDNNGHFGLSYEAYTHFTSPIRRYPDLLVHRTIKAILAGKTYKPGQKWSQLGEHCSMTERRADDASRDVESWLKTFYMRDKIGEVFSGKISAVTSFGAFVLLDGVYVEGLVHISELGKDYFHLRKEIQALVGEKSGVRYRLGDSMTVRVVRADLESAKIDFQIVQPDRADDLPAGDDGARRSGARGHDKHRGGKGSFKSQPQSRHAGKGQASKPEHGGKARFDGAKSATGRAELPPPRKTEAAPVPGAAKREEVKPSMRQVETQKPRPVEAAKTEARPVETQKPRPVEAAKTEARPVETQKPRPVEAAKTEARPVETQKPRPAEAAKTEARPVETQKPRPAEAAKTEARPVETQKPRPAEARPADAQKAPAAEAPKAGTRRRNPKPAAAAEAETPAADTSRTRAKPAAAKPAAPANAKPAEPAPKPRRQRAAQPAAPAATPASDAAVAPRTRRSRKP